MFGKNVWIMPFNVCVASCRTKTSDTRLILEQKNITDSLICILFASNIEMCCTTCAIIMRLRLNFHECQSVGNSVLVNYTIVLAQTHN